MCDGSIMRSGRSSTERCSSSVKCVDSVSLPPATCAAAILLKWSIVRGWPPARLPACMLP